MKRVDIFKAGTHRAMDGSEAEYPAAMLRVTAAAYDPAVYKAPIVVGHPTTDAPAYGWVQGLEFADGTLSAWVDEVDPAFAEAVQAGRYRNVSASFWRPSSPSNPKAGILYLRHVGFLGATPPAVKGLKTVSFAGVRAEAVTVEGGYGRVLLTDAPVPKGSAEDLARRQAAVERSEVAAFCERLEREGRLLPALRGMAEAVLLGVPEDGTVAFADRDGGPVEGQRKGLMKLLALMPKAVEFGEVAGGGAEGAPDGRFEPPKGYRVSPARAALLAEAERIVARDKISFADAVRRAEGGIW